MSAICVSCDARFEPEDDLTRGLCPECTRVRIEALAGRITFEFFYRMKLGRFPASLTPS